MKTIDNDLLEAKKMELKQKVNEMISDGILAKKASGI